MALVELSKDQTAAQFISDLNTNIGDVGSEASVSISNSASTLVSTLNGVFDGVSGADELSADDNGTDFVDALNDNFEAADGGGSVDYTRTVKVYDLMGVKSNTANQARVFSVEIKANTDYVIDKCDCATLTSCKVETYLGNNNFETFINTFLGQNVGGFGTAHKTGSNTNTNNLHVLTGGTAELVNNISIWHEETISTPPVSKWEGKKWLLFGDSITTEHAGLAEVGYGEGTARQLLMQRENISIAGRTTAQMYQYISQCKTGYDAISVMLGTNDQGYNCEIGEIKADNMLPADITAEGVTYIERLQVFYLALRAKYPDALIFFITPLKRYDTDNSRYWVNALNLTTEAYANAMKSVAEHYGIPCIDLWHDTSTYTAIDPGTAEVRQAYFMSVNDGTHPNDTGHATFITPVIKQFFLDNQPDE